MPPTRNTEPLSQIALVPIRHVDPDLSTLTLHCCAFPRCDGGNSRQSSPSPLPYWYSRPSHPCRGHGKFLPSPARPDSHLWVRAWAHSATARRTGGSRGKRDRSNDEPVNNGPNLFGAPSLLVRRYSPLYCISLSRSGRSGFFLSIHRSPGFRLPSSTQVPLRTDPKTRLQPGPSKTTDDMGLLGHAMASPDGP